MDNVITREEHNEFARRMQDEHDRQNHRIAEIEHVIGENNRLLSTVERLAGSMESMQKEQEKQGKRLEILEKRDGEMWRKVVEKAVILLVGAVVGLLLKNVGL